MAVVASRVDAQATFFAEAESTVAGAAEIPIAGAAEAAPGTLVAEALLGPVEAEL